MIEMWKGRSREEWLAKRSTLIGGSDAACVLGLNPWRSNVELWEQKTGRKQAEDLSSNALVNYGTNAEKYLRKLFALDFPDYTVAYLENNLWTNSEYPWAAASLDGWLIDNDGRTGVLEIKTATISSAAQGDKWKGNHIPDYYYPQVLHCMAVINADFAEIKAQLKHQRADGDLFITIRHYHIERGDVLEDIEYLMNAEREFAECLKRDTPPALILPEL